MRRTGKLGAWLIALAVLIGAPASAQTPTDSHLRAAWAAVRAIGANNLFDLALPDIAERLVTDLKDDRPDLADEIEETVYDVALELVPRRLDLNSEVSQLWATIFTEAELVAIAEFYNSDVGRKLNANFGPIEQQTLRLLDDWYNRTTVEVRDRTLQRFQQQGIEF